MSKHEATPRRWWRNARLATLCEGEARLGVVDGGVLAAENGRIVFAGREHDLPALPAPTEVIDCEGRLVTPALRRGVGTVEIKSGYGVNIPAELKMLRVARHLGTLRPVRVRTSYLAAHVWPPAYAGRKGDYLAEVVPPGREQAHAARLVDAVDGFCEGIAFSPQEMRTVFDKARSLNLPVKLHAEQRSNLGGARLAASYDALSADHLDKGTGGET